MYYFFCQTDEITTALKYYLNYSYHLNILIFVKMGKWGIGRCFGNTRKILDSPKLTEFFFPHTGSLLYKLRSHHLYLFFLSEYQLPTNPGNVIFSRWSKMNTDKTRCNQIREVNECLRNQYVYVWATVLLLFYLAAKIGFGH